MDKQTEIKNYKIKYRKTDGEEGTRVFTGVSGVTKEPYTNADGFLVMGERPIERSTVPVIRNVEEIRDQASTSEGLPSL
jgi:hypothetical protein